MTSHFVLTTVCAALALLATVGHGQQRAEPTVAEPTVDDAVAPVNKAQIEAALELATSEADKYEISLPNVKAPAKRVAEPVLKWSNPSVGEIHGNVFLWTIDGRPAVIGSLYKWFTPHTHMSHEFHSLAETPLAAKYGGAEVWRTREGGARFAPLKGAPPPAATAPQRLLQMRRLARGFTATKTERDGVTQELRLLTQPLYRYTAADDGLADGALFVLVQGTDPEVFLLIEARGEKDSLSYWFAATRMNGVEFRLRYQDREVWVAETMPWREIASHDEIYTSFRYDNVALPE
jgi:hypothetical protein